MRQVISEGIQGSPMPAFAASLSEDDIENVVAYVLSWDRRPVPSSSDEVEADNFNWLIAVVFLVVGLAVAVWLVTRFSQRKPNA